MAIRVIVWNENRHERISEAIRAVYPDGIHGCIAGFLGNEADMTVRTATFDEPEHGLTEAVLRETDVLVYWSHMLQNEFSDEVAERIASHVRMGMGLIMLHSGHMSKAIRLLLGTTMTLRWKDDQRERMTCVAPWHPIAAGVPESFDIPHEEMYGEYFDIPKPDDLIFLGWFSCGNVFRSGCTFTRGRGKIFYFQPGHEEFPIYYQPEIRRIITNAVRWAAPVSRSTAPAECIAVGETPEDKYRREKE